MFCLVQRGQKWYLNCKNLLFLSSQVMQCPHFELTIHLWQKIYTRPEKIFKMDQWLRSFKDLVYIYLSTSSLIWPSYTMRATILEKVFQPEKFLKTEHFPTKRIISLSSITCKYSSRTCKLCSPLAINALFVCLSCFLLPLLPTSYIGRASRQ